jgi:hypothetical protein
MTYVKPEVVELVRAAQTIQSFGNHDFASDKCATVVECGDNTCEVTSTSGAYEADE